jgi:transposase
MKELTPEEVAILIKAQMISKGKGIETGSSVTEICDHAGISRKTGYQWVQKYDSNRSENEDMAREHTKLMEEHKALLKKYDDLSFMYEGRMLAMEIHGFDKILAEKKITMDATKKKKR